MTKFGAILKTQTREKINSDVDFLKKKSTASRELALDQ